MLGVGLRFLWLLLDLFLWLGLIFLSYFRLYLCIGSRNFFLLAFGSDRSRIEHTSFVRIFHDIVIVLSNNEFFQSSDGIKIKHAIINSEPVDCDSTDGGAMGDGIN